MADEEALKAREIELLENLNFFLMNYHRLIANGYRKKVLDDEIKLIQLELDKLKKSSDRKKVHRGSCRWAYLH